jgi:hypothetical protein
MALGLHCLIPTTFCYQTHREDGSFQSGGCCYVPPSAVPDSALLCTDRSSRPGVIAPTPIRNSSQSHCTKSYSRHRTIPWTAGVGPLSIRASRWWALSLQTRRLAVDRAFGPWALKRTTQSRTVCSPTPPTRSA